MAIAAGSAARADEQTPIHSSAGYLEFDATTTLTIATGAITITQTYHAVDTEAAAASDDLDTINGGAAGVVVFLRALNSARTIVVKHNTGNILCMGDANFTLDDSHDFVMLLYDGTLAKWMAFSFTPISTVPTAATQAEQETGTATTVYVSPGRQQFHPSAAKGWVNFNGTGTVAINASYNVTSITDNGTGDYTINWTTIFSSENNAPVLATNGVGTQLTTIAAASVRFTTFNSSFVAADYSMNTCHAFGDQ